MFMVVNFAFLRFYCFICVMWPMSSVHTVSNCEFFLKYIYLQKNRSANTSRPAPGVNYLSVPLSLTVASYVGVLYHLLRLRNWRRALRQRCVPESVWNQKLMVCTSNSKHRRKLSLRWRVFSCTCASLKYCLKGGAQSVGPWAWVLISFS